MSVALIAGDGLLPEVIAGRLAAGGEKPVIYAIRESCEELEPYASEILPVFRADIASTLRDMALRGVKKVMFAGLVPKTLMYRSAMLDEAARRLLSGLSVRDDHTLLGGVVSFFEKAGFEVIGYREMLSDLMASSGRIAGREPTEAESCDIAYGLGIASSVVQLSFGQSIVVNRRSVVAVEAMEGTDATIVRAGSICKGGVLVKMIKKGQDSRYDIPTVGPQTISLMSCAGLTCLALQTGWTMILSPDEFAELADEKGIAVVGVDYSEDPQNIKNG